MLKKIPLNIKIIFLLTLVVLVVNLIFLKDFWARPVYGEDWEFLFDFSTGNASGNLLTKVVAFWTSRNLNWGALTVYLGLISHLFSGNYFPIQVINFLGKIVFTVVLFPVIFTLTKNRLLAILSVLFFSVAYPSAGYLFQYMTGAAYWGGFFYALFILIYIKNVREKKAMTVLTILVSVLLVYLALSLALYRIVGFLMILPVIELILLLIRRSSLKYSLIRIIFFSALPLVILSKVHNLTGSKGSLIGDIVSNLLNGNLFMFVNPLAGLALTVIPRMYGGAYGMELLKSFSMFANYILKSFGGLYVLLIFILGFTLPIKSKNNFILRSFLITSLLVLMLFFFVSHYTLSPRLDITPMAVLGTLIFSVAISLGIEWFFYQRSNNLFLTAFVSVCFALFFTATTWFFNLRGTGSITYDEGMHRYLTIPAIGTSVFLSAISTLILQKKHHFLPLRIFSYSILVLLVIFVLKNNYHELQFFNIKKDLGEDIAFQKQIRDSFYDSYLKNKGDKVLYYVVSSQDPQDLKIDHALSLDILGYWIYLKQYNLKGNKKNELGCIMSLPYWWWQKEALITEDHQLMFRYDAICSVETPKGSDIVYAQQHIVTLPIDKLFAFTIKDRNIIDITEEVKQKLQQGVNPYQLIK